MQFYCPLWQYLFIVLFFLFLSFCVVESNIVDNAMGTITDDQAWYGGSLNDVKHLFCFFLNRCNMRFFVLHFITFYHGSDRKNCCASTWWTKSKFYSRDLLLSTHCSKNWRKSVIWAEVALNNSDFSLWNCTLFSNFGAVWLYKVLTHH